MASTPTEETERVLRPFVITTYSYDLSGVPVPVRPVQCIAFWGEAAGACLLRVDHCRPRKTGPCFALTVMRCATHDLAFTLYPPGHVPHGRVAITPISSTSGTGTTSELLFATESTPPERERSSTPTTRAPSSSRRALDWRVTVFESACDAVGCRAWSRARAATQPKRWRTQVRHITLCATILGLLCVPTQRIGAATALGVAPLAFSDAARSFVAARGFRSRGEAVCNALDLLAISRSIEDKLLIAGARSRCWGTPIRCDPRSGRLLALSDAARAPP